MTGRYSLSVSSVNCNYVLELKQKYTIIRGASGTGKSIFADLVEQYTLDADSSGVSVSCEIPVMRLISDDNGTWQEKLKIYSNVIFVVDEFDTCLHKVEGTFAKYVNKSDCYFVIITRRTLGSLSYGIDSIYEFKSITNNDNALSSSEVVVPAYKTILSNTYKDIEVSNFTPDLVIVEDSGMGFDLYNMSLSCTCESIGGKGNVFRAIRRIANQDSIHSLDLIVDACAFGSNIAKTISLLSSCSFGYIISNPQSFEWVCLMLIDSERDELRNPWSYCDTVKYRNIEDYFYELLCTEFKAKGTTYSKGAAAPAWLINLSKSKLGDILPELRSVIIK